MKYFKIAFILLFVNMNCLSQTEYQTKQGIKYKIGDTLHIGRPMKIAKSMIMVAASHWKTIYKMNGETSGNSNLTDKKVVINKIEEVDKMTRFQFRIFNTNFYVIIDEAITTGEILSDYKVNFNVASEDKYDKLKKIKELLDSGALTPEEFESEKKKILSSEK